MGPIQVGQIGLPVGEYDALFTRYEAAAPKAGMQPGVRFVFTCCAGPYNGQTEHRVISFMAGTTRINTRGVGGKFLEELLGRPLLPNEMLDQALNACVGKRYRITVAVADRGKYPRVQSVRLLDPPAPAAADANGNGSAATAQQSMSFQDKGF
jgi:hypothetical protein